MTTLDKPIELVLRQLWAHISRRRRRQIVPLLGLMLLATFAEMVSLGAVLPFIGVLTQPDVIFHNPALSGLVGTFGISSPGEIALPFTVLFIAAAAASGALRVTVLWVSTRVAYGTGSELGVSLYSRTLSQPYIVHVRRNSSEILSAIAKAGSAIDVLLQCLILISSTVMLIGIIVTLLIIDWKIALVAILAFAIAYLAVSWVSRRRLRANSKRVAAEQAQTIRAMQEGLGGIRDILLDGTQAVFSAHYQRADQSLRRGQGNNIILGGSPRFLVESLGIALIATLALVLSFQANGITASLPVLGALALGAQRLLPTLQQAYAAYAIILGSQMALEDTLGLLDQPTPARPRDSEAKVSFDRAIRLDDVSFGYESGANVLNHLQLAIRKGERVGFIGQTGSGKSTTLDILMGLLPPTGGSLFVDDVAITPDNAPMWQRNIAHVPQAIFLADSSLAENIAFGKSPGEIDYERVRWAAEQARIASFIESRVDGYQTRVGERGVKLSGGQRQRIALARALYKQCTVLVLDEATSALDSDTETAVMDAIMGLSKDLTILIVAHRTSTLKACSRIVEIGNGRVIRVGRHDEIFDGAL